MIKILLSLLGLSYAFSPYDLFPDFFVGFGWIDDIIILILLWKFYQFYKRRQYGYGGYYKERRQSSERSSGEGDSEKESFGSASQTSDRVGTKDPCAVLGVGENASPEEIRSAYRQLANKYHPDKVSHLGEEFRELAEKRFKEIQEAYQALSGK